MSDDPLIQYAAVVFTVILVLAGLLLVTGGNSEPRPVQYTCNPGHHRTTAECQ